MNAETLAKVGQVLKAQAMRTHPFQPMERDERYCGYMGPAVVKRTQEHGSWAMRTECGYPPDLHPPANLGAALPRPIGSEPHESAVTHRARKRHRCMEYTCSEVIEPGELYVRAVTFPTHEVMGGLMRSWKFCVACATRYGRPLPPLSDRAQKVDPEAVAIAVRGDRAGPPVVLNRPEREEAVRKLIRAGVVVKEIARRVGVTMRTVSRIKARLRQQGEL